MTVNMKQEEKLTGSRASKKGIYKTPVLKKHGDITNITLGAGSLPDGDGFFGSISKTVGK